MVADQIEIVITKILEDQQDQMSMESYAVSLNTLKKIEDAAMYVIPCFGDMIKYKMKNIKWIKYTTKGLKNVKPPLIVRVS